MQAFNAVSGGIIKNQTKEENNHNQGVLFTPQVSQHQNKHRTGGFQSGNKLKELRVNSIKEV